MHLTVSLFENYILTNIAQHVNILDRNVEMLQCCNMFENIEQLSLCHQIGNYILPQRYDA